jgi:hypothetical protein
MARKPDVDATGLAALVRRAFGTSVPVRCDRTPDGVSTQVYRLVRGPETFYLRGAEEADENLETWNCIGDYSCWVSECRG